MNALVITSHRLSLVTATVFLLLLSAPVFAVDNAPPRELSVKVFQDHYVVAGRPFSDLAVLETWAKASGTRTLLLTGCSGSTKQIVAAVERFHTAYPGGIGIRTLAANEPECVSAGEDAYYATDDFGQSIMP
jgi:hypothetical protein